MHEHVSKCGNGNFVFTPFFIIHENSRDSQTILSYETLFIKRYQPRLKVLKLWYIQLFWTKWQFFHWMILRRHLWWKDHLFMDIWCSFSLKVTVLVFWILIQPFSFFSIRSLEDYLVHFALFSNFMELSPIVVRQCHFYNDLIISILFFCLEPSLKSWKAKLVRRYHVLKPIAYLFGFYHLFITNSRIIEICLHFSK